MLVLLTGCSNGEFGEEQVRQILTGTPKSLDGEQVMLTLEQVNCGEREDLWNLETQGETSLGRLTPKGQALGFADDIRIGEQRFPYTQLRGQFPLQVLQMNSIRDEGAKVKIVDVKVGVTINHLCFNQAPVLMGVKKGQFSQDVLPRFQLALNSDWEYDRLLH
jgi:hypothetical protein